MGSNTNSMDPYNQYNQPGPYGGQPGFDPNCQEGDRGLGKKLAIGAGVAALAVGTAVVAGGIYHHHKKQKKKKTVYVNGKSRDIDCDVFVDDRGIELPGQQFDERGVCVNEQEVLSRAANSGQIQGGSTTMGRCSSTATMGWRSSTTTMGRCSSSATMGSSSTTTMGCPSSTTTMGRCSSTATMGWRSSTTRRMES